jgi:hypothetical protein
MSDASETANTAGGLARLCHPIFEGQDPDAVGAALASLVALHLAGHFVAGDANHTALLREMLLEAHVAIVRKMVPIMEAMHTLDKLKEKMQ